MSKIRVICPLRGINDPNEKFKLTVVRAIQEITGESPAGILNDFRDISARRVRYMLQNTVVVLNTTSEEMMDKLDNPSLAYVLEVDDPFVAMNTAHNVFERNGYVATCMIGAEKGVPEDFLTFLKIKDFPWVMGFVKPVTPEIGPSLPAKPEEWSDDMFKKYNIA